jgi:uncharacterized membrane protein YhdT
VSAIDDLARVPPPAPPPLSPLLEAELAELPAVETRRPIRQLAVLVAASLTFGAAMLALVAMRRDAGELPAVWLVGVALAWLLGFVVPLYLATVPRRGAVMPRWRVAGASAIAGSLAFIVLGLALHPSGASSRQLGWDHFWRGYSCLGTGLTAALVPVVIGAILLRRTLPVGARWIAAALGTGAGSLGGLVLHLHCPVTDGPHVGLVHGGMVGIAALLAAALVPRALDVR